MRSADQYARTDQLDEPLLEVLVTRLEARGKHPYFQRMLAEYLGAMQLESAQTVLDIGCGTGVASRALARRPEFTGRVHGIDLSPYLVDVAARLAREEGLDSVDFSVADTRRLDFPPGELDAVIAHTVVSHVDDPLAVLEEAVRVLRPGGVVGIFDGDYASLSFGHPDPANAKANDEAIIDATVTNPRVMRDMPRLLRAAGLTLVASFSYVLAEIGRADFWLPAIASFRRLVPAAGTMTEAAANEVADALVRASDDGVFFGACNYYSYVARVESRISG
jgi:SAM-dependent methyltransferase